MLEHSQCACNLPAHYSVIQWGRKDSGIATLKQQLKGKDKLVCSE